MWAPLDEALSLARETHHLQRLWPVAAARAEAAWLSVHLETELDLVGEVHDVALQLSYPWAVGELGFWLWRGGRLPSLPDVATEPFRLHATRRQREAADAWRRLGCPYESADALAESEDPDDVREALATLDGPGCEALSPTGGASAASARDPRGAWAEPHHEGEPGGADQPRAGGALVPRRSLSSRSIAARVGISVKTAGHHVSHIFEKLGVSNRAEAAVLAERVTLASGRAAGS